MPKQEEKEKEEKEKNDKKMPLSGHSVNTRGEVEVHKDLGHYIKSVEEEREAEK